VGFTSALSLLVVHPAWLQFSPVLQRLWAAHLAGEDTVDVAVPDLPSSWQGHMATMQ